MLLSSTGSGLTISLYHNSSLSVSILTIERAREEDSGNYTCQPSNTRVSSTTNLLVVDRVLGKELVLGNYVVSLHGTWLCCVILWVMLI